MINLKDITKLPVAESAEGLNLIVNDNGSAKQIAASAVGAQADFAVTDENSPAYIKNKPKIAQADWEAQEATSASFIKNKPFFDTREYGNVTVTFDGDMTGKETLNVDEGVYMVKVSDKAPSKEELIGASASMFDNGQTLTATVTSDMIYDLGNGNLGIGENMCAVIQNEFKLGNVTVSRGLWATCMQQNGVSVRYPSKFSWYGLTSGELKKIEEKYLPTEELDLDIVITQVQDAEGNTTDPTWVVNSINTFENIKNKIFNGAHPTCKCQVKMCAPTEDTVVGVESFGSMAATWMLDDGQEAIAFVNTGLNFKTFILLDSDNSIVHVTAMQ